MKIEIIQGDYYEKSTLQISSFYNGERIFLVSDGGKLLSFDGENLCVHKGEYPYEDNHVETLYSVD